VAGIVLLATGGTLLGTAVAASAAGSISFKQSAPLGPGQGADVKVTGSGFTPNTAGAFFECSTASGQPTIDVNIFHGATQYDIGQLPVSCSVAQDVFTTAAGAFPKGTQVGIGVGHLGPPATGLDSAGNQAGNDAGDYPCPPTPDQGSATCEVMFVDAAGETASQPVQISFQTSTTTTTSASSSSTTAPCNAKSNTVTAVNPKTGTSATVTVSPATCLVSGQTVTVTGQNLQAGTIGSLLECNADGSNGIFGGTAGATVSSVVSSSSLQVIDFLGTPDKSGSLTLQASGGNAQIAYTGVTVSGTNATFTGLTLSSGDGAWTVSATAVVTEGQPTISYLSNAIPVSCTQIKTFTTNPDGTISSANQQFTVVEGTTGPPCQASSGTVQCDTATDSAGNDPAKDAPSFPCPPTDAQTAAGITCVIAVGDLAGDKVPVPISFNIGAPPIPTTTTTLSGGNILTGSGGGSGGSTTSGSGGLAFTGSGPWLWIIGIAGALFVIMGGSVLLMIDAPRRLVLAAVGRTRRSPTHARRRPR
jgi:hypothetical protein